MQLSSDKDKNLNSYKPLYILDRHSKKRKEERIYGEKSLRFLYSQKASASFFLTLIARLPIVSFLFGLWQKMPWTRSKIASFVHEYEIDAAEFEKPIGSFASFNDFFVRKLKAASRPLVRGDEVAMLPADGRYRLFPSIEKHPLISFKGHSHTLKNLLGDPALAQRYRRGSLVVCRLAPPDYHRFHFICDGVPGVARLIPGPLFSVNPLALSSRPLSLFENRRMVTEFLTHRFGKVVLIEVGATNVGSITQTYTPNRPVKKGEEKGFFSFGGSALLLLFEEGKIHFDADLFANEEVYAHVGESMGRATVL